MVQANELRVGNIINSKLLGTNHTVMGFLKNRDGGIIIYTDLQESYSEIDDWQFILLTYEILLKCGFTKLESGWFSKSYFTDCKEMSETMAINYNIITGRCGIVDTDCEGCIAMTGQVLKYLHQLQNLYFALTGAELVIQW